MRQRSEEETHSVTEGTLSKKTKRSWRLSVFPGRDGKLTCSEEPVLRLFHTEGRRSTELQNRGCTY